MLKVKLEQENISTGYKMYKCSRNPTPSRSALTLKSVDYFKYIIDCMSFKLILLYTKSCKNPTQKVQKSKYNQNQYNCDEGQLWLCNGSEYGGWDEGGE